MTILVADIGGTNTRFALYENGLHSIEKWPTKKFKTLKLCVENYLSTKNIQPKAFCAAVAAPVTSNTAELTNSNWNGNASLLPFPSKMINDIEAAAYGLALLQNIDIIQLQKGTINNGISVLIGLGTGFGQSIVINEKVYSTESGHAEFAPFDFETMQLWQYINRQNGRVRVEDIVSGRGLENILAYAKTRYPMEELPSDLSAGVIISLFTNQSNACALAEKLFLQSLGSICGDIALRTKASRIVLCGGVTTKMMDKINCKYFWSTYANKSPMKHIVEQTSIDIVTNEQIGLLGAAVVAKELL
jgi:glucokinase